MDEYGIIDMDELRNSLREDTILITVMHANNEIGTLEPISQISKIAKEKGIYLHTDAVQSVGKIPVNVDDLGVDMLSMSSHKIHGPKGVGALYIRKGTKLEPLLHGGGHERGLRSGTENIAGIVGFAEALSMAVENLDKNSKYILNLRNSLINKLEERIDDLYLNGHPTQCLPNIANIRFSFVEGESMVLMLDMEGVAVSTGSACSSKSLEASHVLKAIGLKPEDSHGSLRFSMGKNNTMEDVDFVVELLVDIVTKLRGMSPLARK